MKSTVVVNKKHCKKKYFYVIEYGGVTKYERIGKCRQCGECCQFKDIFYKSEVWIDNVIGRPVKKDEGEKFAWNKRTYKELNGWSLMWAFSCWWWFKIDDREYTKYRKCPASKDSHCKIHDQNTQPAICRFWPMHPIIKKKFPKCGYSFVKIGTGWGDLK